MPSSTAIILRRALQGRRRIKRLPKPVPPYSVERAYTADLLRMNKFAQEIVTEHFLPRLRLHVARNPNTKRDGLFDDAFDDLNDLPVQFFDRYTDKELQAIAARHGMSLAEFNKKNLNRMFGHVTNIDLFGSEPWLEDAMSLYALNNVQLIKTIPQRFFNDISTITYNGFQNGDSWDQMSQDIQDRFGVSDWNAERLARDQIGKLNGSLTEQRQTDVGVETYFWRGTLDQRERDSHREKEGNEYSWDNPPADTGNPGEDILCRCWAEPNLDKFYE